MIATCFDHDKTKADNSKSLQKKIKTKTKTKTFRNNWMHTIKKSKV
jgi:hypothetical protein